MGQDFLDLDKLEYYLCDNVLPLCLAPVGYKAPELQAHFKQNITRGHISRKKISCL